MNSNNLLLIPLFLLLLVIALSGCTTTENRAGWQAMGRWAEQHNRDTRVTDADMDRAQERFERQQWKMDQDQYRHRQVYCHRWGAHGVLCND